MVVSFNHKIIEFCISQKFNTKLNFLVLMILDIKPRKHTLLIYQKKMT